MPLFARGDVVWVQVPFSEEADFKLRPAVVLALWPSQSSHDYFLCMVSTQLADDPNLLDLNASDFAAGTINRKCYIRPGYVFTAGERFIPRRLGTLRPGKTQIVISSIVALLQTR